MSKLYFFRHAQASYDSDNYDQLSGKGEEQSVELGKYLAARKVLFDKVYVGPLQRQQHTYEIVRSIFKKQDLSLPEPILEAGLLEHNAHIGVRGVIPALQEKSPLVRELIEKSKADPKRKRSNELMIFKYFLEEWVEGNMDIEGILPWKDFRVKVRSGLDNILKGTGSGETVAAFTSGGTIASITGEALNMTDQKSVAALNYSHRNTAFTSFLFSSGEFNLLAFNEMPHLSGEMVTFV